MKVRQGRRAMLPRGGRLLASDTDNIFVAPSAGGVPG
jgi:hypothetical protein